MWQFFANPWMLIGLVGISLPIMAHLLSRRRYDVVEWGAMQFLNPSRKTRRRLKLEELLLLLLRIGLITLIVLAVTRPLIPSGWLSGYQSAGSRTVVLVIDGSNSMSRTDGVNSLHQNAIRRAVEFLQTLGPDDSISLIDARDQPRSVIESPLRDLTTVEEQLKQLPPPGGACSTLAALEKAIGILGRSSAAAREIVVFTDRQANGWKSDKDAEWQRIDDLLQFPAVRPKIWVIDAAPQLTTAIRNVAVGKIELSREMTVPDFPLRLRVSVRNDSDRELQVPVRLMLNGQLLAGESQTPTIPARAEAQLEFEHAIRAEGTHVLSVTADVPEDAITVDNTSHAAVTVATSLPLLLVNGTPSAVPMDRDTFFAELAFAPPEGKPPWVSARVVEASDLKPADLETVSAVMFCNVARITPEASVALADFVAKGNGLMIACGPNTTPESFRQCFADSGLLPQVQIGRIREAPPRADSLVTVEPSLQTGWIERFLADPARSFLKASFRSWCLATIAEKTAPGNDLTTPATSAVESPSASPIFTDDVSNPELPKPIAGTKPLNTNSATRRSTLPVVLARLTTGDPLVIESRYGEGFVLILTSSADRTWNNLPVRSDFVPFLYESVFHIASSRQHRNVKFGEPLIATTRIPSASTNGPAANANDAPDANETFDTRGKDAATKSTDDETKQPARSAPVEFTFTPPSGVAKQVKATADKSNLTAIFIETWAPGPYRSIAKQNEQELENDAFVVNYDHDEDKMSVITVDDRARLATNDRVRFNDSVSDLRQQMYGDESVTELWAVLMTLFLLFLVFELLLTRRTIRHGYGGDAL